VPANCSWHSLQFPFYARKSHGDWWRPQEISGASLAVWISQGFCVYLMKQPSHYFTSWVLDMWTSFVPSGGGQWLFKRKSMIACRCCTGVDAAKNGHGHCMGDAWTNMKFQTFWALPALAIAWVGCEKSNGYCLMAFDRFWWWFISLGFLNFSLNR